MLTPQEVSERVFPKASFGGYGMAQVDEFLDLLTEDYNTLYSENAVLKSKMKVLVDKVEEYRATEEAMRKALMTAQRMADDMVKDTQTKCDGMLQQAEEAARERVASIRSECEAEEFRLASAQRATADYVRQVKTLHSRALDYLDGLDRLSPVPAEPAPEDPTETAASEIDENVQRLLAQAVADVAVETAKAAPAEDLDDTAEFDLVPPQGEALPPSGDEDDHDASAARINFGELQFGRDYEIK